MDLDGDGDGVGVGEVLSEESNSAVDGGLEGLVSSNVGVDRTIRKVESVLLDAVDVDEDTVGGLDINLDHGSVGHEIGGKRALNLVVAGQGRHGREGADEVRGPGSGEGGVGGPGLIGLGNVGVLPEGARGNDGTSVEGDLLSGEAVESTLNNDKVGLVGQLEARAVTPAVLTGIGKDNGVETVSKADIVGGLSVSQIEAILVVDLGAGGGALVDVHAFLESIALVSTDNVVNVVVTTINSECEADEQQSS